MGRLRLQARSAVGGMGTSRDLHCVTQPSNSMAMFSLSSPLLLPYPFLSKIKQNDFHVTNQTSDALQVQAMEFRQNCTDSCKKCNLTKFPFFKPKVL
jgi:hypothetical protein